MLTIEEAKDTIDTYGPNRKRWPATAATAIDALVAGDAEFKRYLRRAIKIDKLLNDWSEEVDGAEVEDDEQEQDEEEHDAPPPQDNETDEREGPDGSEGEEEEDKLAPLTLDERSIQDMDEMFADAIQKLIENIAPNAFNVFSRDLDAVHEIDVPNGVSMVALETSVALAVGPLMKDLRRLIAARSQVRRIPGKRSGRLHGPSLHRIKMNDDRVFSRKEESPSLNTAITLLIDNSGSMCGQELKLATETAFALGSVLNKLGIAFECLGFTDAYNGVSNEWTEAAMEADKIHPIARYTPLIMPKFKAFSERWTIPVQQRFGHVFNGGMPCQLGSTPEGCGMEFAAKRLLARPEERKIMIVMTDGSPGASAITYNPGLYVKQSADMVKSIEAAGIDLIGIGIKHAGPTAYYTNSLVINAVTEMPKLLLGVLKKFIIG